MTAHTPDTDWQAIALALAQRVSFAVNYCTSKVSLLDAEKQTAKSWRIYMAEGMEMIPGTTVDHEMLATLELPLKKRKAAQAEIKKRRAVEAEETGVAA